MEGVSVCFRGAIVNADESMPSLVEVLAVPCLIHQRDCQKRKKAIA